MKRIPLTQGKVALIDDADVPVVSGRKWHAVRHHAGNTWYASHSFKENGRQRTVKMHCLLIGKHADHKNGNGLDNRRENLRPATNTQNQWNKRPNSRCRLKGVYFRHGNWYARIWEHGKSRHIGVFPTARQAAMAYDEAAYSERGEYAWLNFPDRLRSVLPPSTEPDTHKP